MGSGNAGCSLERFGNRTQKESSKWWWDRRSLPGTTFLPEIASLGFWQLSPENRGTSTNSTLVTARFPVIPAGLMPAVDGGGWRSTWGKCRNSHFDAFRRAPFQR